MVLQRPTWTGEALGGATAPPSFSLSNKTLTAATRTWISDQWKTPSVLLGYVCNATFRNAEGQRYPDVGGVKKKRKGGEEVEEKWEN